MVKNNIKILMIGPLPPPTGGMETVMEHIIFMKFHNIEIIPFNVTKNKFTKSFVLFNAANFIYRCLKLFWILLIRNPSIVHIHTGSRKSFWQNAIYFKISKLMNKKIVLHIHGGAFRHFYEEQREIGGKFIKKIIESADSVIVLSNSWKHVINNISITKSLEIVQNPINVKEITKYKKTRKDNQLTILFVGRVVKEKGIYELLDAFMKIKQPTLKLIIMGNYDQSDKILLEYKENKSIEFLGEVRDKNLKYQIYANSDIFVLPSHIEAMPMTILEAMASGLPIIATNVGAIPEIIKNNYNGIIIHPNNVKELVNAIKKLVAMNDLRNDVSKNNKADIKEYDENKFKIKMERIWSKL